FHDTTTDELYVWGGTGWANTSNDFWQTKPGGLGPGDVNDVIEHLTDIYVGRTGTVAVGEGLTGSNNVLVGNGALSLNTGDNNVGIGLNAGQNGGSNRVAIGNSAGTYSQQSLTVAIGYLAGLT